MIHHSQFFVSHCWENYLLSYAIGIGYEKVGYHLILYVKTITTALK